MVYVRADEGCCESKQLAGSVEAVARGELRPQVRAPAGVELVHVLEELRIGLKRAFSARSDKSVGQKAGRLVLKIVVVWSVMMVYFLVIRASAEQLNISKELSVILFILRPLTMLPGVG
eukprot:CAMPEP_0184303382 /NCGR_PEP_ID=MMETSP1049-20130417/13142_1 /TAXON_ID=77928 /ORGANISM="Proteomonas sulcata, Strain CCMP704" /LENGTH=118 /DNA_ID=CAMNT_0026614915 /DNA_START=819 /DNA_END=1175 /DNA_ORIENTATION=-